MCAEKESWEGRGAVVQLDHLQGRGWLEVAVVLDAADGRPWTTRRCLRRVSTFCSSAGQFSHSHRKDMKWGLSVR